MFVLVFNFCNYIFWVVVVVGVFGGIGYVVIKIIGFLIIVLVGYDWYYVVWVLVLWEVVEIWKRNIV